MKTENRFIDKIFNLLFITYVCCVYCFDDSKTLNKYTYYAFIAIVLLVIAKLLFGGKKIGFYKELSPLLLYGSICLLSILWAVYSKSVASKMALTVWQCIGFTVITTYYFADRGDNDVIPAAFAIAGLIVSVYVIQTYGGLSQYYAAALRENSRLGGEVSQLNRLGMNAAFSVVAMFFYVIRKKKYYIIPFMIAPGLAAIGSGSRKALITIVLGVVLQLTFNRNLSADILKRIVSLLVIAAIVVGVGNYVIKLPVMHNINERMIGMFEMIKGEKGDNSSNVRKKMMQVGLKAFIQKPVFGYGVNNARYINKEYVGRFTYLHNGYVENLVNVGLIGSLPFYLMLISLLVKHFKYVRAGKKNMILAFSFLCVFFINEFGMVSYYSKGTYIFLTYWITDAIIERNKNVKEISETLETPD